MDKSGINFPHTNHTLQKGDNYTIFCEGNSPLNWTTPFIDPDDSKYTKISIIPVKPRSNDQFKYASELHIRNITYPFVGFYRCYENEQNHIQEEKLYLFVYDEEHLSVRKKSSNKWEECYFTKYSLIVLPCRPASMDVEVKLSTFPPSRAENEILKNFQYDPLLDSPITTQMISMKVLLDYLSVNSEGNSSTSFKLKMEIE
ncbi:hypothetical protein HHI36_009845, partial [Cryptolaemus montrouzieri]